MKKNSVWIFLLILLILITRFTRQFTKENVEGSIVQEINMAEEAESRN